MSESLLLLGFVWGTFCCCVEWANRRFLENVIVQLLVVALLCFKLLVIVELLYLIHILSVLILCRFNAC
jgi:hypothetical protein